MKARPTKARASITITTVSGSILQGSLQEREGLPSGRWRLTN
jgi:hypothetical protein